MFSSLGRLAARHPLLICGAWLLLALGLSLVAPRWESRSQDDDIRFLPEHCDSVRGYQLLGDAFPKEIYASRLIFALERREAPLTPADLAQVEEMVATLTELRQDQPELQIGSIHSFRDPILGKRLLSDDKKCTLIQVSLGTPYLAVQTRTSVDLAEQAVRERFEQSKPAGLELHVTGPAGVGRDLVSAGAHSLDQTTIATIALVVIILLLVHRAPLLALVPLVTIAMSVWVALSILSLFTLIPGFYLVNISQVFAIVMLYGAGTDYCLFLISRYREELGLGKEVPRALAGSLTKVGGALAASAGTVICGLGLMGLAEFAKVRCGGPAIALSLTIALLASLTLAPALLRLLGRTVFWPTRVVGQDVEETQPGIWDRISHLVIARPWLVWSLALLALLPLAALGLQVRPNYRATGELSARSSSVKGLDCIHRHFTAGETGPVTVLLASQTDWKSEPGREILSQLSQGLSRLENVAEVRSATQPLGVPLSSSKLRQPVEARASSSLGGLLHSLNRNWSEKIEEQTEKAAQPVYLATLSGDLPAGWMLPPAQPGQPVHVARLDIILESDPFAVESLPTLGVIQTWVKQEFPRTVGGNLNGFAAETYGVTVSARDLAQVTEKDRTRINGLVLFAIFAILLVLVRRVWLASYLLGTVLLSYYATLGATTLAAMWWSGRPLGLVDWRVPFFLFIILIAVGEDYNILLITRALKERKRHGAREGMRRALASTGGTITSCGLIMAGTFATLMLAGLNTLVQIGFALAFGVLLDTFLVRPFLVPALTVIVWRMEERRAEVAEESILRMPRPTEDAASSSRRAA